MIDSPHERPAEAADALRQLFPGITPSWMRGADPCWVAWALAQSAEHNPPIYWLGRAFAHVCGDSSEVDAGTWHDIATRLSHAHGGDSCGGQGIEDTQLQEALTVLCATAWSSSRLGPTALVAAAPDVDGGHDVSTVLLDIADAGVTVAPCRLTPERTMEAVFSQIEDRAAAAAQQLRARAIDRRGVLYVDLWHERRFAQSIGYRFEITEPVQSAVRYIAPQHGLGYVLTRPFEWGRPLEEWA